MIGQGKISTYLQSTKTSKYYFIRLEEMLETAKAICQSIFQAQTFRLRNTVFKLFSEGVLCSPWVQNDRKYALSLYFSLPNFFFTSPI